MLRWWMRLQNISVSQALAEIVIDQDNCVDCMWLCTGVCLKLLTSTHKAFKRHSLDHAALSANNAFLPVPSRLFHKSLTKLKYIRYNITIFQPCLLLVSHKPPAAKEWGQQTASSLQHGRPHFHKESQAPALVWTARLLIN